MTNILLENNATLVLIAFLIGNLYDYCRFCCWVPFG